MEQIRIKQWHLERSFIVFSRSIKMLINQLSAYKANIVALQDICWTGIGILENRDCNFFNICDNKDHILGAGFLVSKIIKHVIMDYKPTTPRNCTLLLRGKVFNYTIVNGHVPTDMMMKKKMGFFNALERAYDISPINGIKIVLGDFNAQVGKEAVNFPTTGNYILHSFTNDNGSRLIQFAVSRNMITGSTFHPHKHIHKSIWRSPDGVIFSQIDHLLTERTHESNLMDVKSYQGANIDSNYYLVIACLRARISNVKQLALEPVNTMYLN
jgi:hypothetical protein